MTTPERTKLPRVVCSDGGVWVEGIGLLSEADAARFVKWLGSTLAKHRRRKAAVAATVTAGGDRRRAPTRG